MYKKNPGKDDIDPILLPGIALADVVRNHTTTLLKMLQPAPAGSSGNNCCCCCCCCNGKAQDTGGGRNPNAQASVDAFSVDQELRLDPNSFAVPGGPSIVGTRAVISWSVTAPVGSTVTVQVRTRGLDGNPGVPFADWTNQFANQALIDQVQFNFTGFLGTKVEFRIIVVDAGGTTILAGPPDS